ncbi:MAG TPA: NapC/NirT family cytochrome c, partial [Sideroxyarcus sp.]|nr:NapC/NirT family cytochrome c [Sideroxyarcus sp.]
MANKSRILQRTWDFLVTPSAKYSVIVIGSTCLLAGIVLWGGFNTAMEATNDLEFCISCH